MLHTLARLHISIQASASLLFIAWFLNLQLSISENPKALLKQTSNLQRIINSLPVGEHYRSTSAPRCTRNCLSLQVPACVVLSKPPLVIRLQEVVKAPLRMP